MQSNAVGDVLKVVPSASYVGATIAGFSIGEWASIAALVYSVAMLAFLLWDRVIKPYRTRLSIRKADRRRRKAQRNVS